MSKERKRSIESAQAKMRMLIFSITATGTTPVASSFDRFQIKSVTDLGVGNFTIIFNLPFERDCLPLSAMTLTTAGVVTITAVAYDRVTVQVNNNPVAY